MNAQRDAADAECALLRRTRELLEASGHSSLEIYRETGLKPSWIELVRKGDTRDPSVNRISRLYEFLAQKPLVV